MPDRVLRRRQVVHDLDQVHAAPRRARIVLAEDDDDMRQLLGDVLRRDGYELIEASHGSDLMQLLAKRLSEQGEVERVDLIISDVYMPGWNGIEILEALRDSHVDVPVILITAFKDPALGTRAEGLGAYFVFDKPFDVDDLRTAVVNALSG